METTFSSLSSKEIISVSSGKRLGRFIDMVFDESTGIVLGFTIPSPRRFFKKNEDIFIPLHAISKIGDDCVLITSDGETQICKPMPIKVEKVQDKTLEPYLKYARKIQKEN
ncbi:MAG: YlmC/YmxH family sporulation protein [Clostridia bacterium]